MKPSRVQKAVVADRLAWIERMIDAIGDLPLSDNQDFFGDPRNAAAAESYLR
jgi:hypothetical protein